MAAKQEDAEASNPLDDLTCPLCLDILDDAALLTSCRHTFCRKCLKKYDLSHQDLDHMVCPLCRKVTKLSANRVDDLPTNATVNELVDDYHYKCGGVNAVLEMRPKCNICTVQGEAVSFCRTCNTFMCEKCHVGHEQLALFFKGHEILSIQDVIQGNISIGHPSEKCLIHKQENKDMFCEDCKVHTCFKCVILSHRDHKLKSHEDFEKDLKTKVNELVQRCTAKKSELEKNIQSLETHRHEIHTALQKLRTDVNEAYSTKAKQLEENQRLLVQQIDDLERSFDEDLDVLKSIDRQRIKSICSSVDLVENDRLGRLEAESLSAHNLLCEELQGILKEVTDHTSAASITEKAQKKRFQPSDATRLDLGNITEGDPEPTMALVEEATDHSPAAGITHKAQDKKFQTADPTCLDLGNIEEGDPKPSVGAMVKKATDRSSEAAISPKAEKKRFQPSDHTRLEFGHVSHPKLEVIKCVDLRGTMWGMAVFSDSSVAIGYWDVGGIDIIDSNGNRYQYANISSNECCYDLVFQKDRTVFISTGFTEANVYSPNGPRKSTIQVNDNGYRLRLNRSPSGEILVANFEKHVYIYDPTGSTLKHIIPTKHNITKQTSSTTAGLIASSSCDYYSNPSMVTVYDRNGNAGKSLQAPSNVYLYAAVDEQDRVYVASVDRKNSTVVIRLYDLDGLNLKERVQFSALNLTLNCNWCYLVSLSPTMLGFACDHKLYFIKVIM